jgi:hypothetical protein
MRSKINIPVNPCQAVGRFTLVDPVGAFLFRLALWPDWPGI